MIKKEVDRLLLPPHHAPGRFILQKQRVKLMHKLENLSQ